MSNTAILNEEELRQAVVTHLTVVTVPDRSSGDAEIDVVSPWQSYDVHVTFALAHAVVFPITVGSEQYFMLKSYDRPILGVDPLFPEDSFEEFLSELGITLPPRFITKCDGITNGVLRHKLVLLPVTPSTKDWFIGNSSSKKYHKATSPNGWLAGSELVFDDKNALMENLGSIGYKLTDTSRNVRNFYALPETGFYSIYIGD